MTTVARFFETYLQSKRPEDSTTKSALFYLASHRHHDHLKHVLSSQEEAARADEAAGTLKHQDTRKVDLEDELLSNFAGLSHLYRDTLEQTGALDSDKSCTTLSIFVVLFVSPSP